MFTQTNQTPNANFEWPPFKNERERIKFNSAKFSNLSVAEAFDQAYNLRLSKKIKNQFSAEKDNYRSYQVGDLIPLKIIEVTKKNVIFDQEGVKETIICNTNLYQYPRFRDFTPKNHIKCKVISRTDEKIVVDPFAGMFDEWIQNHTSNLQDQYHISEDRSIEVRDLRLVMSYNNGSPLSGGFIGNVRIDTISDFCGKDVCIEAFIPGSQIVLNIEYDFEKWVGKSVKTFITNYSAKPAGRATTLVCSAKEYLRHQGNKILMSWFDKYCANDELWNAITQSTFEGHITGICHTSNKCGVFVELPQQCITAMIPCKPDSLSKYKRGNSIRVQIDQFEVPTKWNGLQMEHLPPYIVENDILKKQSLRITLKQVND